MKISSNDCHERLWVLTISVVLFISLYLITPPSIAYSAQVYPKGEPPAGTSPQDWIEKWWSWWIPINTKTLDPNISKCIANTAGPMMMLMETTRSGSQMCQISSKQSIMIPMWTGFCDSSVKGQENYSTEQFLKCVREQVNLGTVNSRVKVDDKQVAELVETSSMSSGSLVYTISTMDNVTEIESKGFNATWPNDPYWEDIPSGKSFRLAAQGWFVFLKPLSVGEHKINYGVGVTGTGPNDSKAEITYYLTVKK